MNERIDELAKQANAWYPQGYPSAEGGDEAWKNLVIFEKEDLKKFAELIVRDCIDILMRPEHAMNIKDLGNLGLYNEGWVRGRLLGIEHIKEHFGVE